MLWKIPSWQYHNCDIVIPVQTKADTGYQSTPCRIVLLPNLLPSIHQTHCIVQRAAMQDMPITRSPVSRLISTFAGSQDNWSTFAKVSERKFENHACPLFLFEVTKQKCSRYSHRVGLIRPRDADKEWHDTYCIFRKQNVFFNPSLLNMDRWDDSWESTNFHNFWQNLLDATQLSARCFIAKVRLSWNNLCNTAWRSSRESHESRLISLPDRRPSPTSKSLQSDNPPLIVTLVRWKRCHVGWRTISSSKATRREM